MTGLSWLPSSGALLLLLYGLAVYRLTRLVVADAILDRPRDALFASTTAPAWLRKLIACPWCVSVWIAAGWALAATLLPTAPLALLAFVLAASAVAGLLSSRE